MRSSGSSMIRSDIMQVVLGTCQVTGLKRDGKVDARQDRTITCRNAFSGIIIRDDIQGRKIGIKKNRGQELFKDICLSQGKNGHDSQPLVTSLHTANTSFATSPHHDVARVLVMPQAADLFSSVYMQLVLSCFSTSFFSLWTSISLSTHVTVE